ncbi:MAG TPA: CDGSH iron-sulfur domain-containing protein [Mycobacteriales bacterium]|nr:CDGSH iron-sulfur domain-containing protein [Mycobacteriales bacterium]
MLTRSRALELELGAASGSAAGGDADRAALADTALRLRDSVSRPLFDALAPEETQELQRTEDHIGAGERAGSEPPSSLARRVWELARAATMLRVASAAGPELQEATAALQDLAGQQATGEGPDGVAARLAELEQLQGGLACSIQVSGDGPYLVTNARQLVDWLGESQPTRPQMALCRCGASRRKPFCDGTHAQIGFSGEKDPNRVPDRRETYVGQQVTVVDNRGTCQHSGLCTDRLATVFRLGTEPFVAASGGRMDEIIRAVRDCPSGALSYAVDGVEARADVDRHGTREPAIEVSKDGPYRVTGAVPLIDAAGAAPQRNAGASLEHYALCRCGQSQNKPFCSGMHWYVDFKDPVPNPDRQPTLFEWAGGLPALTRTTRLFYEKYVPQDSLLAPLFANMSDDHPQRVAQWLGEVFCGPKRYSERYGGYTRMISQHIGKGLTEDKRARWVQLLLASAQEAGLPTDPEFRAAFSAYIEWGSRLALENSQPGAKPPEHMPMPRWDWNTAAGPPGSRRSALQPAAEEERPAVLPHPDEPVSFEKHIKTLFRHSDRQSMTFAFDLWAYDDVKRDAHAILERVRAGTMPCDGAWPSAKVDVFERWVTTGMSP